MIASLLDPERFRDKAAEAAGLLRSMANPHRLMILCRLGDKEMSVSELHEGTALSQSSLLCDCRPGRDSRDRDAGGNLLPGNPGCSERDCRTEGLFRGMSL